MDELFYSVVGTAACATPVAILVAVLYFALRKPRPDPRVDELEREVARVRGDLTMLREWLARRPAAVAAPAEAAPGATEQIVPPPAPPEREGEELREAPSASLAQEAKGQVAAPSTPPAPEGEGSPDWSFAASSAAAPPNAPPPVAPDAPLAPPAPSRPSGGIEQWIGVRGAAALGALVLVVAGLYFFEYSVQHGLLGPALRVVLGTLVGAVCVGASEWPLRKRTPLLANWVAGAGVAVLYTAFWASHSVYHLVPTLAAGVLLVAVTGACVVLALRHRSLAIALLGLLGGFITPLALSTGEDRPVPLFAYLLLLDGAILFVAHRRRWPVLSALALGATGLYELLWLSTRMDAPRSWLGVGIVLAFATLFALAPRAPAAPSAPATDAPAGFPLLRAGALALPFALVLAFSRGQLGGSLLETAVLVVVLCAGAAVVARRDGYGLIALGAAAAALATLLLWTVQHHVTPLVAWQLAGTLLLVALAFHVVAELGRGKPVDLWLAGVVASLGGMALIVVVATATTFAHPAGVGVFAALATGTLVLGLLAARAATLPDRAVAFPFVGVAFGVAASTLAVVFGRDPSMPPALATGVALGLVVALAVATALVRRPHARPLADHGTGVAASIALLHLLLALDDAPRFAWLGAFSALVLLLHFTAARRGAGWWALVAAPLAGLVAGAHTVALPHDAHLGLELVVLGGMVLAGVAWPLLAGPRYRARASAWYAPALLPVMLFLPLRTAWLRELGGGAIGALPIALAVVALAATFAARGFGPSEPAARRSAIAWLAAATASFVTLAIPLQLSNEWLTIGWALEACALLALDRRLDQLGLRALALALYAAVAVRLLANPYVLGYYARGDVRIVNWIAYTYLVPAAALVGGYFLVRDVEVARRRPWERVLLAVDRPIVAPLLFSAAVLTVFAWLNLAIVDWYASGPQLSIPTERMPARDLTISIAWALYALALLGLGLWRTSTGLRFASLALLLITCAKVFLFDLSRLHDLYRVAALVGLAFSLLLVSLVYQRFVFRRPREGEAQ